mgnify:CR=1 FL=1
MWCWLCCDVQPAHSPNNVFLTSFILDAACIIILLFCSLFPNIPRYGPELFRIILGLSGEILMVGGWLDLDGLASLFQPWWLYDSLWKAWIYLRMGWPGKWWNPHPWKCWRDVWMQHLKTWLSGELASVALWLGLILKVVSNPNGSMILWLSPISLWISLRSLRRGSCFIMCGLS